MKKAFTLIELLVVIAIIAILAAILFPVFAQAKDAAKKTQSLSNMKQLATSTLIYNNDFDDTMPPSAYIKGFVPQPVISSVYDLLIPYTKNVNIMVSPVDTPAQSWKNRLSLLGMKNDQIEVASYVPNLGLFGENLCPIKSLIGKTGYTPVTSATAIPDSVQTTMFFDGYIKQGTTLDYYTFLGMARHADGLVINFADGHAKYFKWNAVQNIGKEYVPSQYNTAATRPSYYSWRVDTAACGTTGLCNTNGTLQTVSSTPSNPYNDLHGIPGTNITDSEDTTVCP
jgi:prepilin-type N-terminal cleavage/methylation domain-containing protein